MGLASEPVAQAEVFWAIRRLLEQQARGRPLVLVVEDIHWAEPTLLDLIEHIVDWSRDAPMLVLCPARPELLDARPGWGGGKLNSDDAAARAPRRRRRPSRLIEAIPGGEALPADGP